MKRVLEDVEGEELSLANNRHVLGALDDVKVIPKASGNQSHALSIRRYIILSFVPANGGNARRREEARELEHAHAVLLIEFVGGELLATNLHCETRNGRHMRRRLEDLLPNDKNYNQLPGINNKDCNRLADNSQSIVK